MQRPEVEPETSRSGVRHTNRGGAPIVAAAFYVVLVFYVILLDLYGLVT